MVVCTLALALQDSSFERLKNHGGQNSTYAESGSGSPTTAGRGAAKAKTVIKRKHIFLVDDHPIVRERLGELIARGRS